ncbi:MULTISPECIES: retropepsin-like aspartic protease [unclassified Pseudomonas]|uniref:retropepsin-like aspartic protease n=1 Tax=unclassified Pseudomonas TaxID=196821 RepID=UPI00117B57B1|nr:MULTISPECIES: retropepsin-like aspartic protease [unclassified Pseudomonas]
MTSASEINLSTPHLAGTPILFLRPDGSLVSGPMDEGLVPVLRVSIRPAFLHDTMNADPTLDAITALALVDTGADYQYIDEDFAERHGFSSNQTTVVQGATHTSEQKVHPALFALADYLGHPTHAADFTSSPLRRNGRRYDLILGMRFLSHGTLTMDFSSMHFHFVLTGQPNK